MKNLAQISDLINKKYIFLLICGISLFFLGFFTSKSYNKPEIIEKIEYKDRIVEKIIKVEVDKKDVKTHTIKKVTEKPDGTIETILEEKTETKEEKVAESNSSKERDLSVESDTKIKYRNPQYRLSAIVSPDLDLNLLKTKINYGFIIETRVYKPFWLGAGYINNNLLLSLSMEF